MAECELTIPACRARLTELDLWIERSQANENIIEREAAFNVLSEEYWLIEALLAELLDGERAYPISPLTM